ncbi:hypothetical protein [Gallaecimonas mangrovi]|uniref:hypothetical protein n=1 Tax=Gallaecimonas mangrovi TaxID=2291597 RepID=UPI0012602790|nr:hypothetical protein [Gallaecimonas mangrovi]
MIRTCFLIFISILITACSTVPTKSSYHYEGHNQTTNTFTPKSKMQFVATRVQVEYPTPETPTPEQRLRISMLKGQAVIALNSSGAFKRIDEYHDSPYLLDIKLAEKSRDQAKDVANQLVSAATLFILPTGSKGQWVITVDLYSHGIKTNSYRLTEDFENSISSRNLFSTAPTNEQIALENAMNHLINEIKDDSSIPLTLPDFNHFSLYPTKS